ncbi:hypothetical protein HK104_003408 [Borealophlyctis nickersoniae]|nr:hypothetical protein HK104_003408 [Borealophlyctis nickersoniae]
MAQPLLRCIWEGCHSSFFAEDDLVKHAFEHTRKAEGIPLNQLRLKPTDIFRVPCTQLNDTPTAPDSSKRPHPPDSPPHTSKRLKVSSSPISVPSSPIHIDATETDADTYGHSTSASWMSLKELLSQSAPKDAEEDTVGTLRALLGQTNTNTAGSQVGLGGPEVGLGGPEVGLVGILPIPVATEMEGGPGGPEVGLGGILPIPVATEMDVLIPIERSLSSLAAEVAERDGGAIPLPPPIGMDVDEHTERSLASLAAEVAETGGGAIPLPPPIGMDVDSSSKAAPAPEVVRGGGDAVVVPPAVAMKPCRKCGSNQQQTVGGKTRFGTVTVLILTRGIPSRETNC